MQNRLEQWRDKIGRKKVSAFSTATAFMNGIARLAGEMGSVPIPVENLKAYSPEKA